MGARPQSGVRLCTRLVPEGAPFERASCWDAGRERRGPQSGGGWARPGKPRRQQSSDWRWGTSLSVQGHKSSGVTRMAPRASGSSEQKPVGHQARRVR